MEYVVTLKYWLSRNPKLATVNEFEMIYLMAFSHAQAALHYRTKDEKELLMWAELMYCAGYWAHYRGNWTAEDKISRGALEAIESQRGADDESTLKVACQLGNTLDMLRKYEEAETIFRRVLKGKRKILEPDHSDIIASLGAIAFVLLVRESCEKPTQCICGSWMHKKGVMDQLIYIRTMQQGSLRLNT
jgi:hypothetical protein